MTESIQVKIEEQIEDKTKSSLGIILSWMFKNIPFLIIPFSRLDDLTIREMEYEMKISKRKFITRLKSFLTILGIIIVFGVMTMVVFPHWISPYSFAEAAGIFSGFYGPPSPTHLLGQTEMGRDVLARLIFGARSSIMVALPSITMSVVIGLILGLMAAYYGGWIDALIMRTSDVFLAFPALILTMVLVNIWGQRIEYIMLSWGLLGIPYYARLIRGNVLQARELPYINAARVSGARNYRIMFKHILPNVIQPVIIAFTFNIGGVILGLAGLAYLGFSDSSLIEWGNDINLARAFLPIAPWASLWPGLMILITVFGFMLVGDGLRDALDPKLKNL